MFGSCVGVQFHWAVWGQELVGKRKVIITHGICGWAEAAVEMPKWIVAVRNGADGIGEMTMMMDCDGGRSI